MYGLGFNGQFGCETCPGQSRDVPCLAQDTQHMGVLRVHWPFSGHKAHGGFQWLTRDATPMGVFNGFAHATVQMRELSGLARDTPYWCVQQFC